LESSYDIEIDDEIEEVSDFNEKKNYKLARALEDASSMLSSINVESIFHVQLPTDSLQTTELSCEICSQGVEEDDKRFENFNKMKKIASIFHEAFAAG